MSSRTEIEIPIDDFNQEVYRFYFDADRGILYLDFYGWFHRDTKRKGWKLQKQYDRLRERESEMKESEVLLSDELKQQVIKHFTEKLKVEKWSSRK